ncbi:MAG: M23 family metallopeptidase [Desulfovibrio sp.]|nr:M23 family metallopeptidase [Desulfovibrio sp.]
MSDYNAAAEHIKGHAPKKRVPGLAALLALLALLAVLAWQAPALASGGKDAPQAGVQAADEQSTAQSAQDGAGAAQAKAQADGKDPAATSGKDDSGRDASGKDGAAAAEPPKDKDGDSSDTAQKDGAKDASAGTGKPGRKDAGDGKDSKDGKDRKDGKKDKSGKKDRKDGKGDEGPTAGEGYSKKHLWPPVGALITSPYGAIRGTYRVFGAAGVRRHGGVDLRAHLGWPVTALRDGTVLQAGPRGPAGIAVDLKMKDGRHALYFHLSKVLVKPGETVSRGQHLGLVGCTGRTTGAHLHFAMKNEAGATIDPTPHIQGLWELFDPPASDLRGTIQPQSCDGHRYPGGYPWAGRNYRGGWRGKPWRGRHYGPLLDGNYFNLGNSIFGRHAPPAIRGNRRLRGTQQYLRMRRALQGSSHYRIQDPIPSWESQHK